MPLIDYDTLYKWARAVDAKAADDVTYEHARGEITSTDYAERLKEIIDARQVHGREQ